MKGSPHSPAGARSRPWLKESVAPRLPKCVANGTPTPSEIRASCCYQRRRGAERSWARGLGGFGPERLGAGGGGGGGAVGRGGLGPGGVGAGVGGRGCALTGGGAVVRRSRRRLPRSGSARW